MYNKRFIFKRLLRFVILDRRFNYRYQLGFKLVSFNLFDILNSIKTCTKNLYFTLNNPTLGINWLVLKLFKYYCRLKLLTFTPLLNFKTARFGVKVI